MIEILLKPLSVNCAFQGKRFKTPLYKKFERDLLLLLPSYQIPDGKLSVTYQFGFSSVLSDLGNPEKLVTDILCKKYGFNDNRIFEIRLLKEIVPKGCEYIHFEINAFN